MQGMIEPAVHCSPVEFIERPLENLDSLLRYAPLDAPDPFGDTRPDPIAEAAGVGIHGAEQLDLGCVIPGLFQQFAAGGLHGRFSGIDQAAWEFEGVALDRGPVLAHYEHAILRRHRDHGCVIGLAQRIEWLFTFPHRLTHDLEPRCSECDFTLDRLQRRFSSTHGLLRRNSSVRTMPCSMVNSGFHPNDRMRAQSRKMNGLSPTHPRSPPA